MSLVVTVPEFSQENLLVRHDVLLIFWNFFSDFLGLLSFPDF